MYRQKDAHSNPEVQIPILITSSITPHDTGVKLSDPQKRLFHAIEAIEHWIRVAPRAKFVLCDGSNYDFQPIARERFPKNDIECLRYQNDQSKIAVYGRGYGEGEIVKFALEHSAYLRASDAFAKCSSKLWVENFAECLNEWQGDCLFSGVFKNTFSIIKPIEMIQVDTRFYIMSNDFYIKNLVYAHRKIGVSEGFGLEDSFHQALRKINKEKYLFSVPPVIKGVGGGTGKYYKSTWLRVLKEKGRISSVKRSPKFHKLFNF
jgi:hypothetical protein